MSLSDSAPRACSHMVPPSGSRRRCLSRQPQVQGRFYACRSDPQMALELTVGRSIDHPLRSLPWQSRLSERVHCDQPPQPALPCQAHLGNHQLGLNPFRREATCSSINWFIFPSPALPGLRGATRVIGGTPNHDGAIQ
jgi:hypothetical protein